MQEGKEDAGVSEVTPSYHDLVIVNARGNEFPYATEVEENWTPWGEEKDCDSFMSWKHWTLFHKYGWPERSLRAITCFAPPREGKQKRELYHAVLAADIDGQTYILENGRKMPTPYQDFLAEGYELHKLWNHDMNCWEWAENADRSIG